MELTNHINEELTEIEAGEISMESFEIKDELCPEIWEGMELKPKIRLRLLDIADDFIEDLNIKWVKPLDIYFTGSLANYNWSAFSDIDVHIVYDYSEIYDKKEFVEEYFSSKKNLWNEKHDELEIMGFPVEMGVEDSNNPSQSSGVYSLNSGKWIRKPEELSYDKMNEGYVKEVAARIMTLTDDITEKFDSEQDAVKKGKLADRIKRVLSDLKEKRKSGLKKGGEMNSDNIVYKLLRRYGYLDRMRELVNKGYDYANSITEGRNAVNEEIDEYTTGQFNTDDFAGLPFTKKVQYCTERLGNPIGNGSSRMVFDAGSGKVLKLAKNKKGLSQNIVEIQNSNDCYYGDMFPEVFEADEENGTYIVTEFAEKAKKSDFKQRIGVTYDEFVRFCRGFESEYAKRSWFSVDLTQEEYDMVEQNETLNAFYYYITNMQPYNVGEIIALRNLGFVKRNGEYDLVIVDSGFDEEVAKMYGRKNESVKRRVFVLTESQVALLTEALTADELYSKYYNDLDKSVFDAAVKADPTSKNKKPGKYVKWILNLARKGEWKPGDSYETKDALSLFSKFGGKLDKKDIGQYKSVKELLDSTREFRGQMTKGEEQREQKKDAEKVYEDSDWTVIIPHTKEASMLYGKGTKWCTAAENNNYFDYYSNQGPLYIIIPKGSNSHKWQFHFESNQFMNNRDVQIPSVDELSMYGDTDGLFDFLMSIDKKMKLFPNRRIKSIEQKLKSGMDYNDVFDSAEFAGYGFVIVQVGLRYNYMDEHYNLLSDIWFKKAEGFDKHGLAIVEFDRNEEVMSDEYGSVEGLIYHDNDIDDTQEMEVNFINTNGEYLFQDYSDSGSGYLTWAADFDTEIDGLALVEYCDEKDFVTRNFINLKGQLVLPWFDGVDVLDSQKKVLKVSRNEKYTLWSIPKGCLYGDAKNEKTWADRIVDANSFVALGFVNGKNEYGNPTYRYKLIDYNGKPFSDIEFDEVTPMGIIGVNTQDGYKTNIVKDDKYFVFGDANHINEWPSGIGYANEERFAVDMNGKYFFVDNNGERVSNYTYDRIMTKFRDGFANVKIGNKYYLVNTDGVPATDGFESISGWTQEDNMLMVKIMKGNLWYLYNMQAGKIIQNVGMREIHYFRKMLNGITAAECETMNGKEYYMDTDGNIRDLKTMDIVVKGNIS